MDDLMAAKARAEEHGLDGSGPTQSRQSSASIYFFDPQRPPLELGLANTARPEQDGRN